jgi:Concanavalin A-like lectin/glucanases superfamily
MKIILSIFVLIPFFILGCKNSPTQATTASLQTQGLLAYYPFNGNANDASGKDNNGIVYDAATLTSDRFGKSNSAYYFTGGAHIGIPELFPDTVSAFTFAAWVMKDTMDYETHEIIYKGLDQGEAALGITRQTNGTVLGFGVNIETGFYGDQNWYFVNVPDTLRAKIYYFLVGRYIKGGKVDLLINGQLMGSSIVPDLPLAKWPTHSYSAIGTHTQFPTTTYWNGVIDDIRVYNQALSDEEVQSLYHEGGWTGN